MAKKTAMISFRIEPEILEQAERLAGSNTSVSEWYRGLGAKALREDHASKNSLELIEVRSLRNLFEDVLMALADNKIDARSIYEILKNNSPETIEVSSAENNSLPEQTAVNTAQVANGAADIFFQTDHTEFRDIFSDEKMLVRAAQTELTSSAPNPEHEEFIQ